MRRFALRDLRSDEGLGLIETVVSLLVFGLIMSGLAASMVAFAKTTTLAKTRASATALAQQLTEKARAVGSTLLENCNNVTPLPPPTAQYRSDGVSHTVVQGSSTNCIKYQVTTAQDGMSYNVTRLVLARASNNDVSGQPQSEKYFVVQISWSAGATTKTYELDTIFTQKGAIAAAPAQGIRFVIKDINGNVITADPATWAVQITGANCTGANSFCTDPSATTAEGTYSQIDMAPGTYTCQAATTTDASSGYFAAPSPANAGLSISTDLTTISGTCQVSAGTVTDFVTTWKSSTDCATSNTTGTVPFTVTDTSGAPLANMTVTMTNVNDGTKTYTGKTGASGTISIKPPANWYSYTVTDSAGSYQTAQNSYGPLCVIANQTYTPAPSVQMQPVGGCATSGTNGTITFNVVDSSGSPALSGFKVAVTSSTGTVTSFPNTNASGVSSKAMKGGPYTYVVTPPSGSAYQGSGVLALCLLPGATQSYQVKLSTTQTCARDTAHKGSLAFLVTDQTGAPIPNAVITLTNVNGDALPAGAPFKTGADGTKTITNAVVDPYQYKVTGPNGNYLASDTLGPVCVTNGATTNVPTVQLYGLMNVVVTVQNNDSLPWKNYQISLIDPRDPADPITQTVTVPNCTPNTTGCTRNPSAAITFSGLVTNNGWIVQVQTGSNANVVDSGTFNFTTPFKTYTSADFPDLAMTDDSGGA